MENYIFAPQNSTNKSAMKKTITCLFALLFISFSCTEPTPNSPLGGGNQNKNEEEKNDTIVVDDKEDEDDNKDKEDEDKDVHSKLAKVFKMSKLHVEGASLLNEDDSIVQLTGVSYGWHNWWPRFYNSGTVSEFANVWGATVLRAAMGVEPEGSYLTNPTNAKEKVFAIVDAAIKDSIYVIVDWHAHDIHTEETKRFFVEVATKYKGVPNVLYEIYNEPTDKYKWATVKAHAIEVIKAIREVEEDAIIIVPTPNWDQLVDQVADDPIEGYENIMYTLHFYAASHTQWHRNKAIYALKKGLPMFVTECASMSHTGDGAINKAEWNAWLELLDENCISWITWSVSDKDESCSMLFPTASSTGAWTNAAIKPWGKIVKEELQSRKKQ